MNEALRTVTALARRLPVGVVEALGEAAAGGVEGLRALRASSASASLRDACNTLIAMASVEGASRVEPLFLAGALAAAAEAQRERQRSSVEVVWTGPRAESAGGRLTLAVVTDLIAQARRDLLLVSYAAHTDPHLNSALEAAAERGVAVTLLLERHEDNPRYQPWGTAFAGLAATRLAWPAARRPAGASMHAKLLVVDDEIALVGSANLTSRAMESNLECGLLVRGHTAARTIRAHVAHLHATGELLAAAP